jgi:adenylate cyclase
MLRPMALTVTFLTSAGTRSARVKDGRTLLWAARRARLPVARSCRAEAVCGSCRVIVVDGADRLAPPDPLEAALLQRMPLPRDERYACRARALGPVTVTTRYW